MLRKCLVLVLAVLPACDSKGTDTDSESHFACQSDSDCPTDAGPAMCVAQRCELVVVTSSAQTCDAGKCPLSGTWDIVGTALGETPKSAIVTLSPTYLTVLGWKGSFSAIVRGDTFDVAIFPDANIQFSAARTAGSGDTGIIPLPLFGDWDAHAANEQGCVVHAKPDSASATCAQVGYFPNWLKEGNNATLTATRTQTLSSLFGDFGGVWTFTTGSGASCTIRVENATVSADCSNALNATGTASFTLDGDTGHGTTSRGIEFTAQRL